MLLERETKHFAVTGIIIALPGLVEKRKRKLLSRVLSDKFLRSDESLRVRSIFVKENKTPEKWKMIY